MPITLKYGAPGAILQSGFAAGVGQAQKQQKKDLLDVWQQQNQQGFQAQQAELARQQQLGLQQNAQAFQNFQQKGQNEFNLKFRNDQQKFLAEENRLQRNAMDVRDQADRFQRAGERELDRDARKAEFEAQQDQLRMRGLASRELELPAAAQREMDQLEEGLIAAGKLDPAQQEEYRQKYEKRARELRGFARPAKKSPEQVQMEQEQARTQQQDAAKQQADWQKQQQAAAQQFQKDTEAHKKMVFDEARQRQKDYNDNLPEGGSPKSVSDFLEDAKNELSKAGFAAPETPQILGGTPPGQSRWGDVVPKQNGTPAAQQEVPLGQEAMQGLFGAPVQPDNSGYQSPARNLPPGYEPGSAREAAEANLQRQGVKPWDAGGIQTELKKYPDLPPEVAKGITPELVQKAADQGSKDPVQAAIEYHKLTGSLPRPASMEDALALGEGAAWVAPDGTIKTNPPTGKKNGGASGSW